MVDNDYLSVGTCRPAGFFYRFRKDAENSISNIFSASLVNLFCFDAIANCAGGAALRWGTVPKYLELDISQILVMENII